MVLYIVCLPDLISCITNMRWLDSMMRNGAVIYRVHLFFSLSHQLKIVKRVLFHLPLMLTLLRYYYCG